MCISSVEYGLSFLWVLGGIVLGGKNGKEGSAMDIVVNKCAFLEVDVM